MITDKQLSQWAMLSFGSDFADIVQQLIQEVRELRKIPVTKLPRRDTEAAYFREMRRFLGFDQAEMAKKLGVHPVTVGRWEIGRNRYESAIREKMEKLCADARAERGLPEFVETPVIPIRRRRKGINLDK